MVEVLRRLEKQYNTILSGTNRENNSTVPESKLVLAREWIDKFIPLISHVSWQAAHKELSKPVVSSLLLRDTLSGILIEAYTDIYGINSDTNIFAAGVDLVTIATFIRFIPDEITSGRLIRTIETRNLRHLGTTKLTTHGVDSIWELLNNTKYEARYLYNAFKNDPSGIHMQSLFRKSVNDINKNSFKYMMLKNLYGLILKSSLSEVELGTILRNYADHIKRVTGDVPKFYHGINNLYSDTVLECIRNEMLENNIFDLL